MIRWTGLAPWDFEFPFPEPQNPNPYTLSQELFLYHYPNSAHEFVDDHSQSFSGQKLWGRR